MIWYPDIVKRLVDLERLSILPADGERCVNFTSADRSSRYDPQSDSYRDWAANDDGHGFVRFLEDGRKVLAEIQGAGYLAHIWTAELLPHPIQIYVDDAEQPVFDRPYCSIYQDQDGLFSFPELTYASAGAFNTYVPLSFQKSCRIVASPEWNSYYAIQFVLLPDGSQVEPCTGKWTAEQRTALEDACRVLSGPVSVPEQAVRRSCVIEAGEETAFLRYTGSGKVTWLSFRPSDPEQDWRFWKGVTLSVFWDGEKTPSIWTPVMDFFGRCCGGDSFTTYPLGGTDAFLYCRFVMPFWKEARLVIRNDNDCSVSFEMAYYVEPIIREQKNLGYFHAKWNRECFQSGRKDRWPDDTLLKTEGKGRFVGLGLHVFQEYDNADPLSSPGEYWWGEGDEKFFVDGEFFPSWFGTGSEDYFGYAWAIPELFSRPYHAQIHNEGGIHFRGNRSLLRLHVSEAVPFYHSFEAALEKYHSNEFVRYGAIAYWYLERDGKDPYLPISLEDRTSFYEAGGYDKPGALVPLNAGWEAAEIPGLSVEKDSWSYECCAAESPNYVLTGPAFVLTGDPVSLELAGTAFRDPYTAYYVDLITEDGRTIAAAAADGEAWRTLIWNVRAYLGCRVLFRIHLTNHQPGWTLRVRHLRIPGIL